MRRDPFLPLALAAGAAAVLPPAVLHRFGGQEVQLSGAFHFWAVGASALVATVAGSRSPRPGAAGATRGPPSSARRSR
ncbi:MAG TPA: hypothetical protein VNT23_06880 [Gaiellaceae bacterium]|nr:hypothetical protein [Gaiellaceae bacterium]